MFSVHFLLKNADNRSFYNPKVYEILNLKLGREKQVRRGEFLYNKIIVPKKQVKIISLTREPIGRNVAAFFLPKTYHFYPSTSEYLTAMKYCQ